MYSYTSEYLLLIQKEYSSLSSSSMSRDYII